MSFKVTKEAIARSAKCPPGMHIATLIAVEDEYFNEKGTSIQKCDFETTDGYVISKWFNDKFMSDIIEFVEAIDKVKLTDDIDVNLKSYENQKVCISVSHQKDKNNKIQANIDNFFSADKVPF